MKKEPMLYGIIGLLLGIITAWSVSVYSVNSSHTSMMKAMNVHSNSDSSASQDHSTASCNNLQCSE